jgi:hypothetical protein
VRGWLLASLAMRSIGYMYKRVVLRPDWMNASGVDDIYSISGCISQNFADYIKYWKHNGFWLFDSPAIIESLADDPSISLKGSKLFYYEAYEQEYDGKAWLPFDSLIRYARSSAAREDSGGIRRRHLRGTHVAGVLAIVLQRCCGGSPHQPPLFVS